MVTLLTCGGADSSPGTTHFRQGSQKQPHPCVTMTWQDNAWHAISISWETSSSPKTLKITLRGSGIWMRRGLQCPTNPIKFWRGKGHNGSWKGVIVERTYYRYYMWESKWRLPPTSLCHSRKKQRKLEGCDLEATLEERIKLLSIGFWVDQRLHR